MDKGVYCLIFKNTACHVHVGALGKISFLAGWHIYVGSALGSGGLKRLKRHIRLANESHRRPKWHVDYILTDANFSLKYAVCAATEQRLECQLADALGGQGMPRFGCSDCTCITHLYYRKHNPHHEIVTAFQALGIQPTSKTIITPRVEGTI